MLEGLEEPNAIFALPEHNSLEQLLSARISYVASEGEVCRYCRAGVVYFSGLRLLSQINWEVSSAEKHSCIAGSVLRVLCSGLTGNTGASLRRPCFPGHTYWHLVHHSVAQAGHVPHHACFGEFLSYTWRYLLLFGRCYRLCRFGRRVSRLRQMECPARRHWRTDSSIAFQLVQVSTLLATAIQVGQRICSSSILQLLRRDGISSS